jgi:hypothetical protein
MIGGIPDTALQACAAATLALALIHTFSTQYFEQRAARSLRHAGLWHLLGEVEVVFGLWAFVWMLTLSAARGVAAGIDYLESQNFTEPMFVFAIMVIAGSRPILVAAASLVSNLARLLPIGRASAVYFLVLSLVPLLGSLITEPAAMTLAALMLRDTAFAPSTSERLKYATLGVLFVNVSIGGTLTHFSAPPVLMVATAWHWDTALMLSTFGWKAALAVFVNALALTALMGRLMGRQLSQTVQAAQGSQTPQRPSASEAGSPTADQVPLTVITVHMGFLAAVVIFSHHPVIFMGLLLFFIGYTTAYAQHQSPLILREALLVAFFLAGLVVLGSPQRWWLQPLIAQMDATVLFYGATLLTAATDNAALTYLGSLVPDLSEPARVALVAGAVTGGGLTVVANAPNPAGVSILKDRFEGAAIQPLRLLAAAIAPTAVAAVAFRLL